MNWSVYILLCDQKTLYVGMTNNFERRLLEHINKESIYTKKFSEIACVYKEQLPSRQQAEKREAQLIEMVRCKEESLDCWQQRTFGRVKQKPLRLVNSLWY